jgi:hypothetical protein
MTRSHLGLWMATSTTIGSRPSSRPARWSSRNGDLWGPHAFRDTPGRMSHEPARCNPHDSSRRRSDGADATREQSVAPVLATARSCDAPARGVHGLVGPKPGPAWGRLARFQPPQRADHRHIRSPDSPHDLERPRRYGRASARWRLPVRTASRPLHLRDDERIVTCARRITILQTVAQPTKQ